MRRFSLFAVAIFAMYVVIVLYSLKSLSASKQEALFFVSHDEEHVGVLPVANKNVSNQEFIEYCNKYQDLQKAFCGGSACFTEQQASRCKDHWFSLGIREGRRSFQEEEERTTQTNRPSQQQPRLVLRFEDWLPSRFETLRKDQLHRATNPTNRTTTTEQQQQVSCPQCLDLLVGSIHGKRILLLGHELNFAGGEILLQHMAELFEHSGASVRYLFLCPPGPLLEVVQQTGMSYKFWNHHHQAAQDDDEQQIMRQESKYQIDFHGFDAVLANTAAVETWHHFFETSASYLSTEAMDHLMAKTALFIHEYNVTEFTNPYMHTILHKVQTVVFVSHAGRSQWAEAFPVIANKSDVVWCGVKKELVQKLQRDTATTKSKMAARGSLGIPEQKEDDVVILQAATIQSRKGPLELVRGFALFLATIPPNVLEERAWFLVFVGHMDPSIEWRFTKAVQKVNGNMEGKGSRSRVLVRNATADVAMYYLAADIFILNSVCENFGMVVLEAMFAGLPAIARACGGSVEQIVHNETGLLLPTDMDNSVALVMAFRKMTMSSNWQMLLRRMGENGLERARALFSYAHMARELSNVFSRLLYFSSTDS